jgi:ABC-2 type transport system permease protein
MNFQRVGALVRKELKKTVRDPAALFMIILFPVIMTVMFGVSFGQVGGGGATVYKVGVVDLNAAGPGHHWSVDLVQNLSANGMLEVSRYDSNASAQEALSKGGLAAVVVIPPDFGASLDSFRLAPGNSSAWVNATVSVYSDKGSLVAVQAIPPMVQQALADTAAGGPASGPSLPVAVRGETVSEVSRLKVFDYVAPGLFAFGAIFMIMIVAQTLTSERENGLLRRMATTPLSASELMGAQAVAYLLLAMLQAAVIFGVAAAIGYRPAAGAAAIVMAFVIVSVFSLCCVGFGLITAALARSSGAATGIAFVFIMPLMFLGTFVSAMAPTAATSAAGAFVPSHYVTGALTDLFLRGASPLSGPVLADLGILVIASVVILGLGIQLFRKTGRSG